MRKKFKNLILVASLFSSAMLYKASAQNAGYVAPLWGSATHPANVSISTNKLLNEAKKSTLQSYVTEQESFVSQASDTTNTVDEIKNLAQALDNNPVIIFNYVRNSIDYQQYLGMRKGPELTLLEGSANDLDTCSLLASLLKYAEGVSEIQYVYGVRRVPVDEISKWLGLADDPFPGQSYFEVTNDTAPLPDGMTDIDAKRISNYLTFQKQHFTQVVDVWPTDVRSVAMSRFWLRIKFNNSYYDLDPSFKRYKKYSSLSLSELIGYDKDGQNKSSLMAEAGGDSSLQGRVTNLNYGKIKEFLVSRTQNICSSLKNKHSGIDLNKLIGGKTIIKEEITSLSQAFDLPNNADGSDVISTAIDWSGEIINNNFKSKVTFVLSGVSHSLPTSLLKGRKVYLAATGNRLELWIENTLVKKVDNFTGSEYLFSIEVTHPVINYNNNITPISYTFRETKIYKKSDSYVYAIIYGFNPSGRLIQMRHGVLQDLLKNNPSGKTKAVRSEILNIMGLTWLYQNKLMVDAFSAQNDVINTSYHNFGRMAQEEGYYIDVGLMFDSTFVADGVRDQRYHNVFHLTSMFASAFEHAVIEQLQPGSSAVSTVKILSEANKSNNGGIYCINKSLVNNLPRWSFAKDNELVPYNAPETKNGVYDMGLEYFYDTNGNGIRDYDPVLNTGESWDDSTLLEQFEYYALNGGENINGVNTGGTVILPANPNITNENWSWRGSGWVLKGYDTAGMIINGGYSGGFSINSGWVDHDPLTNISYTNPSYTISEPSFTTSVHSAPNFSSVPKMFGSDPVDMSNGAFVYSNIDMQSGVSGAPKGLAFSRNYSSVRRKRNDQNIGYGWTHSLHIRASERTATEESLGLGNPRQMAPFIVAMTIASDLYRQNSNVKENAIAALVVNWFTDAITNNAVTVTIGDQMYQFLRNPDASFEPPSGSQMKLTQTGSGDSKSYKLEQRNNNAFIFEKCSGPSGGTEQRIKQIIDPDGFSMSFVYKLEKPFNRINYVEDAFARRYKFSYDSSNRIKFIIDTTDSRKIAFDYDGSGNLITYLDPLEKKSYYDYFIPSGNGNTPDPSHTVASQHQIVRLRNHDRQVITQNVYDSLGRVSEQYHHGKTTATWKLRYTGQVNTETNPAGGVSTYYYDERGRSVEKLDPNGIKQTWKYDSEDRIVEMVSGSGEKTQFKYDSMHNVIEVDHPRGGGKTSIEYDSLGRIDLHTDPDGNQTDYVYNPTNKSIRPDKIIDPEGATNYQYYTGGVSKGQLLKVTDQQGLTIEYGYDGFAHPAWRKEPGGFTTYFKYSGRGDLITTTDPNGVKEKFVYNKRRQVIQEISDWQGNTQATRDYYYNNQGLLSRKIDAPDNGGQRHVIRYSYSPTEKLLSTWTSDNNNDATDDPCSRVKYDSRDWQYEVVDPAKRITKFTPQPNGQPWKTVLPLNRTKVELQDGDGRPVSGSVPGSDGARTTGMVYDVAPSGFPRTVTTTADGLSVSLEENRSGQTRFYTNRKSKVWEFKYDGLGRRTHVITPLDKANGRSFRTTYHHRGVVKKITEPSGQETEYNYSATTGRLVSVQDELGTINHTLYDANGNLLESSEDRGGATKYTKRTYDSHGRLSSRTDENGQTIGYRYYPSGKVFKIIYPGGSENGVGHVQYTWWKSGQIKEVIDKLDSTTNPRITKYTWRKDGRLSGVIRPNKSFRSIQYDSAGRPKAIQEYEPGNKPIFLHDHKFYASDEMRSRVQSPKLSDDTIFTPPMRTMTYNADNQLSSWNGDSVTHDADGNMIIGPSPTGSNLVNYGYDARNRLKNALGTNYTYDSDGQRVRMVDGEDVTTYVTDVGSPLSKVLVRTKNGVSTRYVWGLGLIYEVNGSGADSTTVSYHHDATGNTLALTGDNGKVVERIGYTPWGQINYRKNKDVTLHDTPFLFTGFFGNQTDSNGLLYMRNRYYHPRIGRFLNADPAQEGMNWYGYAGGNPIGMVDPMGLGISAALDMVQTTLNFMGMLPGVGAVFDIVNAGISIARGNYVDAGFNLVSAIPGIGDFAAGAKIATAGAAAYGGYRAVNSVSHSISAFSAPVAAANTAGRGPVIIGETMNRVKEAAKGVPGAKILNDMPKFRGTDDQVTSSMMQYNRKWILEQMRSGRPIIDIGTDATRKTPSIFYQMEQNMIKNYQKLHPGSLNITKP